MLFYIEKVAVRLFYYMANICVKCCCRHSTPDYIYFFLSKILNYADDDDDNDDRIATQKLNVFTIDWCCVKNT